MYPSVLPTLLVLQSSMRSILIQESEVKLQRELDLSRRARCLGEAEAARRASHIKFQGRWFSANRAKISKQIVHMVEHIEEFRAEFEMLLLGNRKLFDQ
jgi:hypothetical protein